MKKKKYKLFSIYGLILCIVFIIISCYCILTQINENSASMMDHELREIPKSVKNDKQFRFTQIDEILDSNFAPVKSLFMHLNDIKEIESNPSYNDLYKKISKKIYTEVQPIIHGIVEKLLEEGIENSWPADDERIRQIRERHLKDKYIDTRVWEIEDIITDNNYHTYVEMKSDGSGLGRIVQMKDNIKNGYYIDFYNRKVITIRKLLNGNSIGLELSYYNESDTLQTFAYYDQEGIIGPAFHWDENGEIIKYEYFSQPTQISKIWPPDIRIKEK